MVREDNSIIIIIMHRASLDREVINGICNFISFLGHFKKFP